MQTKIAYIAAILTVTAYIGYYRPLYAQNPGNAPDSEVTCMVESPLDGSLWMGTAGHGLYRLSKTGSRLHFGASGGKLASDTIIYICFDSEAKLWILGAGGTLTSYTAKDGFKNKALGDEAISGAIYLPKTNKLMLSSVTKLLSFNPQTESIESSVNIPFKPVNLKLSSDSTFVWIFGEDKVARLADDGTVIEWSGVGDVSNLLPLEFETYSEQAGSNSTIWIIILISIVALGGLVTVGILLRKRRSIVERAEVINPLYQGIDDTVEANVEERHSEPAKEPEKPVEKPQRKAAPVTKSSEFTTRVMMLIDEHYTDPEFDVDAIAELTGVSRIHVNRKLKAEGSPSPSALIREKRMEVAKYYLLQSEMPMAQIASECGFRSASYFTTAFKEYTGVTPSEFVAKNRA